MILNVSSNPKNSMTTWKLWLLKTISKAISILLWLCYWALTCFCLLISIVLRKFHACQWTVSSYINLCLSTDSIHDLVFWYHIGSLWPIDVPNFALIILIYSIRDWKHIVSFKWKRISFHRHLGFYRRNQNLFETLLTFHIPSGNWQHCLYWSSLQLYQDFNDYKNISVSYLSVLYSALLQYFSFIVLFQLKQLRNFHEWG